jgi:hypothetical protein
VNPNAALRYTPALSVPESSFESAADPDFLTGFDDVEDEEDEEEEGEPVCARPEIVAQAVIPRTVIPKMRSTLKRTMPLMFPSYKDISPPAFRTFARTRVWREKKKGGCKAAQLASGY